MTSKRFDWRRCLRKTWMTFFGRYGKVLPIQEKAIPVVLEGKNTLIVSSTASGKTEAVVAPLIERSFKEHWEPLAIVYISPTRALVNDLYHRLREQFEDLEIHLSVKTGDRPRFHPPKLPNMLITTPESLDSVICKYPLTLKNLKAVVLDEIHLLDNTYRGDQLRILLKRLRNLTEGFNTYALSATVSDPERVASRYMEDFEIISSPGSKEIHSTLVNSFDQVFDLARRERLRKLLVFCNKRESVEEVASRCRSLWGKERTVVHHGSLSKSVREEAEAFMKESTYGICVATVTLEIGIDIGSIDAVLLAEVPWSVSSLLQRIGRGNRRTQKVRVFGIYSSDDERQMLEHMIEQAKRGWIEPVNYAPDLSVVVQQVFSSLYANPSGLDDQYLLGLLSDFCSRDNLLEILNHLNRKGWIENKHGRWYATIKLMDLGEMGKIHSNIPSARAVKVIDARTKQPIGEVRYPIDEVFVLAGRAWKVVEASEEIVYVYPTKAKTSAPTFKTYSARGAFSYLLPAKLRKDPYNLDASDKYLKNDKLS